MEKLLDIYTDYLISCFGQATNLSHMLEGEISHDTITLSSSRFSSSALWLSVKLVVRDIEKDDGVIIFDDCRKTS